MLTKERI